MCLQLFLHAWGNVNHHRMAGGARNEGRATVRTTQAAAWCWGRSAASGSSTEQAVALGTSTCALRKRHSTQSSCCSTLMVMCPEWCTAVWHRPQSTATDSSCRECTWSDDSSTMGTYTSSNSQAKQSCRGSMTICDVLRFMRRKGTKIIGNHSCVTLKNW